MNFEGAPHFGVFGLFVVAVSAEFTPPGLGSLTTKVTKKIFLITMIVFRELLRMSM